MKSTRTFCNTARIRRRNLFIQQHLRKFIKRIIHIKTVERLRTNETVTFKQFRRPNKTFLTFEITIYITHNLPFNHSINRPLTCKKIRATFMCENCNTQSIAAIRKQLQQVKIHLKYRQSKMPTYDINYIRK
jgi:hypothetical protein